MSHKTNEINCQDLAVVAFGSEQFDNLSKSALCTLLEVILKKLDCENEEVIIEGPQCSCIKDMSSVSRLNEIKYSAKNVKPIPNFSKVNELERRTIEMDTRLKEHFVKIRRAHSGDYNLDKQYWAKYERNFEDNCGDKEPENKPLWDLLQSRVFMPRIKLYCTKPTMQRIRQYIIYVGKLKQNLSWLHGRVSLHREVASLIQPLIYEVQNARAQVDKNSKIFELAMKEVQEKLISKMDQVHFPVIRKAVRDRFAQFENAIAECIKNKRNELKIKTSVEISESKCLSCGKDINDLSIEEQITEELCFCSYELLPEGHNLLNRMEFYKKFYSKKNKEIVEERNQSHAMTFSTVLPYPFKISKIQNDENK